MPLTESLRSIGLVAALVTAQSTAQAQDLRSFDVTDLLVAERSEIAITDFIRRGLDPDSHSNQEYRLHRIPAELELLPLDGIFENESLVVSRRALDQSQFELYLDAATDGRGLNEILQIGPRTFVRTDTPESVEAALERLRLAHDLDFRLEATLVTRGMQEAEASVVLSADGQIQDGRTRSFGLKRTHARISHFEPQVAMASSLLDPVTESIDSGAMVAVRVRRIPFLDRVLVECLVRHSDVEDAEPITFHSEMGPIDRVSRDFHEAGFTFSAPIGEAMDTRWRSPDGVEHELRIRVSPSGATAGSPRPPIAFSNLMNTSLLGFAYSTDEDEEAPNFWFQNLLERTSVESSQLVDVFDTSTPGNCGILAFRDDNEGRAVARQLGDLIGRTTRSSRISAQLLEVTGDAPTGFAEPIGDGTRRVWSFDGPIIPELPNCVGFGAERTVVLDHDSEIAQGSRVMGPAIELLEVGAFVTMTPHIGASGRVESVTVAADTTTIDRLRAVDATLSTAMLGNLQAASTVLLNPDQVSLELPELETIDLREHLAIGSDGVGSARIEIPGSGAAAPTRRLLLQVRIIDL
ncbi:MAG: hypothetical protein AAF196_12710 [Planctomycetota bacterium]